MTKTRHSMLVSAVAVIAVTVAAHVRGFEDAGQSNPRPVSGDFVAAASPEPLPPPLPAMIDGLREATVAAHITMLASPSLEGRGLGSRGLEATTEYVAAQLALAGVAPAKAATGVHSALPYFQTVPVREIGRPTGDVVVEVRRGEAVEANTFLAGVDVLLPELRPQAFTAPVVFAGYGIREPEPARDDYRDLDVSGKLVLLFAGLPPGPEWQTPDLMARYGAEGFRARYAKKLEVATARGARGIIAIDPEALLAHASAGAKPAPTFFAPYEQDDDALPVVRISARAGEALLAAAGLTLNSARDARPRPLPATTARVRLAGEERLVSARNVIGVVRGSDPARFGEAVMMGAHMDHLGRIGDAVYPGADDNASGVAALLEIARAVAAGPAPSRSILFAFWTGEEEGHLGSGYYVSHPVWPLERTVAYLNLDMIGHPWKPEEIRQLVKDAGLERGDQFLANATPDFVELGVADWSADLPPVLVRAARGTGVAMHLDRTDGRNGGSDYRAFARRAIPFVRFFGNYFDGYHEPIDTADKLDARQVLTMARVALASAWLLASP